MHDASLPTALQRLIPQTHWEADTLGQSSAQLFRIEGPETFYLKMQVEITGSGLSTEAAALRWLGAYLPVPEVVYYERENNIDYLLMRALPGLPASDPYWQCDPNRLVRVLAQSLVRLHQLDISTCPFDQRTETKLREVAENVAQGAVDADDFDPENHGRTPEELLERLYQNRPETDDLVVTHGDFCLPNLMLQQWELSGFIDLGSLGVADRYQDLALCTNSLRYNLGTDQYNQLFFETYGLTKVNDEKLAYFRMLDELK